mmetsp:Transcript_98259/g.204940  ORF Transcript_98259/g.204940 Transcript_98259/m.204940 type:complete len:243 (+) Transcript_98259:65-793(+)
MSENSYFLVPEWVLAEAGTLCSAFFFLSPALQMIQVIKTKGEALSTVNPQTLILMFFNCSLWAMWGLWLPMSPAVPGNILGLLASSCYLVICWGHVAYYGEFPMWNLRAAMTTLMTVIGCSVAAKLSQSVHDTVIFVGNAATLICIAMFASPLTLIGQVIQEKNSDVLPPAQCWMQFFNCSFWTMVGINEGAMPILVCNVLGLMLAIVQLVLIMLFPAKPKGEQTNPMKELETVPLRSAEAA